MERQSPGDQFVVAFYQWAREDFRREITEGFPFLSRIRQRYLLLRQLPAIKSLSPEDQLFLASALVKRFHFAAARAAGDIVSAEEERLYSWYMSAIRKIRPEEFKVDQPGNINRRQFATLIKEELKPILGDDVEPFGRNVWRYWTPVGDLMMLTYVDIGGQHQQLTYSQALTSRATPYAPLGMSILSWLGISSQTMWDLLTDSDCPEAARVLGRLCSHFIEAVDRILH